MDPGRPKNKSYRNQMKPIPLCLYHRVYSGHIICFANGRCMWKLSHFDRFSKHAKRKIVKFNRSYCWREQYNMWRHHDIIMLMWHHQEVTHVTQNWHFQVELAPIQIWHVELYGWHMAVHTWCGPMAGWHMEVQTIVGLYGCWHGRVTM